MRVDIHTHFLPWRLYEAAQRGRLWYGASLAQNLQGQQHLVLRGTPAFQP